MNLFLSVEREGLSGANLFQNGTGWLLFCLVKPAKQSGFYTIYRPEEPGQRKGDRTMALTRRALKAMGIEDDKIDEIISMHSETVNGLKEDIDKYKANAEKLPAVQKELDELKAKGDDGWKEKHDKVKKEFDQYKADQTAKESKAAKESAARAYYQSKNITGKALEIAMRGSTAEIEALVLEDGKIKDSKALDDLVAGDFAGLVGTTTTTGANTATPPANTGGGKLTKADIYKKDDKGRYVMTASERQKALIENQIT